MAETADTRISMGGNTMKMTFEKLKQMYDDRYLTEYQETVTKCGAEMLEQILCYGHKFPYSDCTIEKCHGSSLVHWTALPKESDCAFCRRELKYCRFHCDGICERDD